MFDNIMVIMVIVVMLENKVLFFLKYILIYYEMK